ncbi:hypothetical protein Tco_0118636, partial [Tanacetum coccineum]
NEASHVMDEGKLGPKWEGPYEVMEALGDGAYKLRSMDGAVLPQTWNIANLKKCMNKIPWGLAMHAYTIWWISLDIHMSSTLIIACRQHPPAGWQDLEEQR